MMFDGTCVRQLSNEACEVEYEDSEGIFMLQVPEEDGKSDGADGRTFFVLVAKLLSHFTSSSSPPSITTCTFTLLLTARICHFSSCSCSV